MKKLCLSFLFLIPLFFLTSCIGQYGNNISQNTSVLQRDTLNLVKGNVFLFFDGEQPNFDYSRKSLVEVVGNQNSNDEELINRLKYQAYLSGANVILHIKSTYVSRQSGYYNDPKSQYAYLAKVYSGLAVRMNSDSLYKSGKYGNWQNTDFLPKIQMYQKAESDDFAMKTLIVTLGILIGVVYLITKS